MRSIFVSMLVLCTVAAAMVSAQSPMRPGRWEVTMQMQMPNMPMQMPATKTSSCITAEQLGKDPASSLPSGGPNPQNQCKVTDYKFVGNTATWKVVCSGRQEMTADGEMTYMEDSYVGSMKMTTPQGMMSMKLEGKRLGDCTP